MVDDSYMVHLLEGIGEELAGILQTRVMIMDGGMGTMIQSYSLSEEDFRGVVHKT